jgi:hypothetical protein
LRSIAAASQQVYTFDIDPAADRSGRDFSNVNFIIGPSATTLPPIISRLNECDRELNFALVDGDHSEAGVKGDLVELLKYIPKTRPLLILMHDSSNPAVRKGISEAPWDTCPFVHMLDLDYVPGMLYDRSDIAGQIWGGFAAALLLPTPRTRSLSRQSTFAFSLQALQERGVHTATVF